MAVMRWRRVTVTGADAEALVAAGLARESAPLLGSGAPLSELAQSLAAGAAVGGIDAKATIELPDLSEYVTPLAKARFLLDTAAEIEHALMLQYLYAGYSLKDRSDATLSSDQKKAVVSWRNTLVEISVQEMAHLMSVENLLLFLRQPPNFEREDFPPRSDLYPFPMNLQPLTQTSLARYVIAESPPNAMNVSDICNVATGGGEMPINHVGILYAVLGVVFSRQEDLETNSKHGEWHECVRRIARRLYSEYPEQPAAEWHLPDAAFDPSSRKRQASEGEWGIRVHAVENRAQCLEALEQISIEGEGVSMPDAEQQSDSHFERFLKLYRGGDELVAFPADGEWVPTRALPTNPVVRKGSEDPEAISDPTAVKWAQLADQRYAILLGVLQHYFTAAPDAREAIVLWSLEGGMRALSNLSGRLTAMPRGADPAAFAALPFTLPPVINLPVEHESRVALLRRRLERSGKLVDQLLASYPGDELLSRLKQEDERLSAVLEAKGPPPNKPGPGKDPMVPTPTPDPLPKGPMPAAEQDMLDLLKRRRVIGQVMHGGIPVSGGGTLSDLFREEKYPEILAFLRAGTTIVDPYSGRRLIVPGKPEESGFYLQITQADGAMAGRLSDADIGVVKRWIESLMEPTAPMKPAKPVRLASQVLASGLVRPVFLAAPVGDRERLFVVEQGGTVKILSLASGGIMSTPFLRLTDISSGGERGLLGLAFPPDFAESRRFIVNCTNPQGHTEIRSYRVSDSDPNIADEASRQVLLTIRQPFANHNGGWIAFGPRDGYLYIATGDGGSANDPENHAQNLQSLLGKLLRIDVRGTAPEAGGAPYEVPADNPFVGRENARPEIWAYGLRNPWRCGFDRETGDLYLGDVGQNAREEISFQPAGGVGGENFGWRLREGFLDTGLSGGNGGNGGSGGASDPLVDPIHDYGRSEGFSVIGGYVYRGERVAAFRGLYVFGDFGGRVWTGRLDGRRLTDVVERTSELVDDPADLQGLTTFGEDSRGELYFATLGGQVRRVGADEQVELEDRWSDVASIRIHPAIGVARVGNAGFVQGKPTIPASTEHYFVGPERPGQSDPPPGGYKLVDKIRRQAARFRLYAYDSQGRLIGELTSAQAEITWTVELANRKASFREFDGLSSATRLRNAAVTGMNRRRLDIEPGPRSVTGPGQHAAFDNGSFRVTFQGQSGAVDNIYLGEIQTDSEGRLLVLAGEGIAQSPVNAEIRNYANNNGWYDTIADGPVRATVRLRGSNRQVPVSGAWVLGAPPKFAPALRNIVTLYDVLTDIAVKKGWRSVPDRPSFRHDVYPILQRVADMKWVFPIPDTVHQLIPLAVPPASTDIRKAVFSRLRPPSPSTATPGQNMPLLLDDSNGWSSDGKQGLSLTATMYEVLRKWSEGEYVDDWAEGPPTVPDEITPEGLDQAALENCAGGAFFPGIEAGWILRDTVEYLEPYRLKMDGLRAGDISRQMALPWQADFLLCRKENRSNNAHAPKWIGWWPQQRPDNVFRRGETTRVDWTREKLQGFADMVAHWHELGFVVADGDRYVDTTPNADDIS